LKLYTEIKVAVGKRGSIIAGTGSNSTAEAIEATQGAEKIGVDACLLVVPYYNNPPRRAYTSISRLSQKTPLCPASFTMFLPNCNRYRTGNCSPFKPD
jgi:4-hydroxy-tetrahydrodipicolinate synthase